MKPKFKVGDKIYYANSYPARKEVQCPDCLGEKIWGVKTPSGEEFTIPCSTCSIGCWESTGKIYQYVESAKVTSLTIGSIQTDSHAERPIRYMCEETGVGSGTLYNEEDLFSSRIQALDKATEMAKDAVERAEAERIKRIKGEKKKSRRNPIRK